MPQDAEEPLANIIKRALERIEQREITADDCEESDRPDITQAYRLATGYLDHSLCAFDKLESAIKEGAEVNVIEECVKRVKLTAESVAMWASQVLQMIEEI